MGGEVIGVGVMVTNGWRVFEHFQLGWWGRLLQCDLVWSVLVIYGMCRLVWTYLVSLLQLPRLGWVGLGWAWSAAPAVLGECLRLCCFRLCRVWC